MAEFYIGRLHADVERAEIAGSLRRGSGTVKDAEIVAIPKVQPDLFGDAYGECRLHRVIVEAVDEGLLRWRAETHGKPQAFRTTPRKYYALVDVQSGCPVDLFVVRPPAQWGAIMAIRTGPADYSRMLVTKCREQGLVCKDGRLMNGAGETVPTPTEEAFFEACGVAYVRPERRR